MIGDKIKSISYWSSLLSVFALQACVVGWKYGFGADVLFVEKNYRILISLFILGLFGLLSRNVKNRIVHLRFKNPLPGSQAFSRWIKEDPRINTIKLKEKIGKFPTSPKEQNLKWYELYQAVKCLPEVVAAQKKYILFRDQSLLHFFMFIIAGVFDVLASSSFILFGYFFFCFIVLSTIAKNYAVEFVKTTVAIFQHNS